MSTFVTLVGLTAAACTTGATCHSSRRLGRLGHKRKPSVLANVRFVPKADVGSSSFISRQSIEGCLHNPQCCLHRGLLIVGNLVRQEVSNPHHACSASALGEDLKRSIVVRERSTFRRPDELPSIVVHSDYRFPQHHPIAECYNPRSRRKARIGHKPRHQSSVQGTNVTNCRPDIVWSCPGHDLLAERAHFSPSAIEYHRVKADWPSNTIFRRARNLNMVIAPSFPPLSHGSGWRPGINIHVGLGLLTAHEY